MQALVRTGPKAWRECRDARYMDGSSKLTL